MNARTQNSTFNQNLYVLHSLTVMFLQAHLQEIITKIADNEAQSINSDAKSCVPTN
jgi:hypothetical protein